MTDPERIHINDFTIRNPEKYGIHISGRSGVTISNGTVIGGQTGIRIGGSDEAPPIDLVEMIRSMPQNELDEVRRLLQKSNTREQVLSVLSQSTVAEKLLERGVKLIDSADKITQIIGRIGG